MNLTDLRTLGRSGLAVSPLALGTMTMGTARWGSADDVSKAIFDAYVDAGGNFIDTADVYAGGRSEELLGGYVADRTLRDRAVLATKYTWNTDRGNPLGGGNGHKNMRRALAGSLRRLRTDYVDLYWLHHWDQVTPVEEVVQAMGDLVRAGAIRYYGFSNVPAWYVARAVTLAESHGAPGPIALQLEYSLVERHAENEHMPAARELGLGLTPWSPLAGGFLAGKYERPAPDAGGAKAAGEGRLTGSNPFQDTKFTDRNWATLDAVRAVAEETGRPAAQVALAWVAARSGVTSPIIGARTPEQLHDNVAALDVTLAAAQTKALDDASAPAPIFPYSSFNDDIGRRIYSGVSVRGWR